jgi:hypothetical protein
MASANGVSISNTCNLEYLMCNGEVSSAILTRRYLPVSRELISSAANHFCSRTVIGSGTCSKGVAFGIAISMDGLKKQTVEKNQANARMRVSSITFTDSEIMLAGARLF